jgi:hypothetical protein
MTETRVRRGSAPFAANNTAVATATRPLVVDVYGSCIVVRPEAPPARFFSLAFTVCRILIVAAG